MANAGGKLGPSIKGKGDGTGATSTRPVSLPDHKVLSNRDKTQLRRINWSLKQVLIVLAFLMLIVALK